MESENLKMKHRLLVLMDFSQASYTALRNAVSLSKLIDGSIEVFQVKAPTDIVKHENQLTAMRAIDEEHSATKKKLQSLVNLVSEEENIPIIYDFTFGNVKNEIREHIEKTNPDIVVIGRRNQKLVNFLGDGVTRFLLKNYSGALLIAGEDLKFKSPNEISLGFFSDSLENSAFEISKILSNQTKKPIRLFGVHKTSGNNVTKEVLAKLNTTDSDHKTIVYEFEEGDNVIDRLSTYVSKNKIELLFMGRGKKKGSVEQPTTSNIKLNKTIQKLSVPILILGTQEHNHKIAK